jgi:hypothetical protein
LNGVSSVAVKNSSSSFVYIAVMLLQDPSCNVGVAPKGRAEHLYVTVIELHGAFEVVMVGMKEDTIRRHLLMEAMAADVMTSLSAHCQHLEDGRHGSPVHNEGTWGLLDTFILCCPRIR